MNKFQFQLEEESQRFHSLANTLKKFIVSVSKGLSPFSDTLANFRIGQDPTRSDVISAFISYGSYYDWCCRLTHHCEASYVVNNTIFLNIDCGKN